MRRRYVFKTGDYLFRLANKTGQGIDSPMAVHSLCFGLIWYAWEKPLSILEIWCDECRR